MIEFPPLPAPNGCTPSLIDYGGPLRSALGGATQKIDRLGSRFRVDLTYPPMEEVDGRIFISRLIRAKREGLRAEYPLLSVNQGLPGSPLVNGSGQAGYALAAKGLTPNYVGKEGYWLSIVRDGQHYLHNVAANFAADATGLASISIFPALRVPFLNNDVIHLGKPMIEGIVDGDEIGWQMSLAHHIEFSVTIEEAR
jgi:hypothetical protein